MNEKKKCPINVHTIDLFVNKTLVLSKQEVSPIWLIG